MEVSRIIGFCLMALSIWILAFNNVDVPKEKVPLMETLAPPSPPVLSTPHIALEVDFNTKIQGKWYHLDFYQAYP
jgi:hypothetical protein